MNNFKELFGIITESNLNFKEHLILTQQKGDLSSFMRYYSFAQMILGIVLQMTHSVLVNIVLYTSKPYLVKLI